MTDRYQLNETRSPIDPSSWNELNENWELIKSYLRFLERQIKFLAGGNEIDDILLRIDTAIANAENATADVEQARIEFNSILNDLNALITNAESATENANTAASNANELNTALNSLKAELETLQTNLNNIVQTESERVLNEQNRVTAEQSRKSEETTRRENEAARVLKEQSRETAELNRTTTFDTNMLTAEQKITMMQYLIDNLKSYDFDLSTTYNFPNLIKWNGSTFIVLKTVTGVTPTDDGINYRLVAQRGVDGTGAVSSVNGNGPDANGNVEVIMALVNNLVSDSTTAGLTAAQGKALKVLFDGLQQTLSSHVGGTDNPHGVTAEQLALGNVQNFGIATQAEAEAEANNTSYMTPQRTQQAIAKHALTLATAEYNTDPNTTLRGVILTNVNVPVAGFWYIETLFYSAVSVSSNRRQTAYGYTNNQVYGRVFRDGTWGAWVQIDATATTTETVNKLALNAFRETDLLGVFPIGVTIFYVQLSSNPWAGYTQHYATVETMKTHTGAWGNQRISIYNNGIIYAIFARAVASNTATQAWSPWHPIYLKERDTTNVNETYNGLDKSLMNDTYYLDKFGISFTPNLNTTVISTEIYSLGEDVITIYLAVQPSNAVAGSPIASKTVSLKNGWNQVELNFNVTKDVRYTLYYTSVNQLPKGRRRGMTGWSTHPDLRHNQITINSGRYADQTGTFTAYSPFFNIKTSLSLYDAHIRLGNKQDVIPISNTAPSNNVALWIRPRTL